MLYRPEELTLWDTTLFEDDGTFHLFFLQTHGLGHAVSTDLTTWTPAADIDLRGKPGDWNEHGGPLTGCLVKHEGRFYLFAGSLTPDTRESVYGVFTSDDLTTWEPHPANPVLRAPESFGHEGSTRDWGMFDAWRDPVIQLGADGRYHAYLSARSGPWDESRTGAVVAHASSADLIEWQHHEPLFETDRVKYTEVPGLFELDGRHYLHFLDHGWGGLRIHSPSRQDTAGTYYLVAPSPEGPYEWPEDPLLIGGGHDRVAAWASRTIEYDGGHLLYHHTASTRPAFGALKRIRSNPDGTLYLQYFPAIEALEIDEIRGTPEWQEHTDDAGVWTATPTGASARARAVGSSAVLARDRSDLHLECTIRIRSGARAGVVLRSATTGEGEQRVGVVVALDAELQQARIEVLTRYPYEGWGLPVGDVTAGGHAREIDTVRLPLERDRPYALRCFARAEFFDVYLDDVWLFTRAIPTAPASGDVELMTERGEAEFTDLRLARLPALP